jgi:hypothetical protein
MIHVRCAGRALEADEQLDGRVVESSVTPVTDALAFLIQASAVDVRRDRVFDITRKSRPS